MANILLRIQEIASNEGITIAAMERSIGASKGVLSRAISNGTDIQAKWLQYIVENYPRYSPEWLLTGIPPMLKQSSQTTSPAKQDDDNIISIPMVEISVAAGCGGYDNPNYLEIVDEIKMPCSMIKGNAQYYCIRVKGESMSPTILDSSYVIIRLLDRSEWEDMPSGHIYVVSDREGRAYIKRVKNRFKEHGFIVCTSDNTDKVNYPNFNIEEGNINSILHAEWYISAKMPNLNETYYDKVNHLEDDVDWLKRQMQQVMNNVKLIL